MFCGCFNDSDEKQPNKNICPICLAHPGTLPTINKKAVEAVLNWVWLWILKFRKQVNSTVKIIYPILPKGYQISQYDKPLVVGGELNSVKLRRIHLEEDTASLIHGEKGESLVDFNRAGVPLMELVTSRTLKWRASGWIRQRTSIDFTIFGNFGRWYGKRTNENRSQR